MPEKKQPVFSFKLSAPALRALKGAGIYAITDFADWAEADVKKLHGIGPSAMEAIKKNMAENDIMFTDEQPSQRK
jgi:DNA-directed RNA polymerase alpha subunit